MQRLDREGHPRGLGLWGELGEGVGHAGSGAEGRIATYQVCDWKTPLPADVLLGRHYPGDGVIDFATLTAAVEATGYTGDIEVEIFNQEIWDTPFAEAVARTAAGFDAAVVPHLAASVTAAR